MSESNAARRLEQVRSVLTERGLHGLLVSHPPNVRYLTGFSGSSGWLLVSDRAAVFATDGRYEQQAAEELPAEAGFEIVVLSDGVLAGLAKRAADELGGAKAGFEAAHLSYSSWERLTDEAGAVEWETALGIVEGIRAVKDAGELASIEKAAAIAARALRETLPLIKVGVREADIAAELDYRISVLGSEGPAFETIVASGARTALPHASTGLRKIQEGDLLLCDFGARWLGYCSDMTRTFIVGEPSRRQEDMYRTVLRAQTVAMESLTDGVAGKEVDAAARQVFEAGGVAERFPHSTGHGVGLEVHEGPRLGRQSEDRVVSGMVVTLEPGLYFPGWGGIRIEDDLVVTEGRPSLLADFEKDRLLSLPA